MAQDAQKGTMGTSGTLGRERLKHGRVVCPDNLQVVKCWPCIMTGGFPVDPAHYPIRRSHLGNDGLFNLIPLSRYWHDKLDNYNMTDAEMLALEGAAHRHWKRIANMKDNYYMGTPERVAEILEEM